VSDPTTDTPEQQLLRSSIAHLEAAGSREPTEPFDHEIEPGNYQLRGSSGSRESRNFDAS
jgi:hypothetical protein